MGLGAEARTHLNLHGSEAAGIGQVAADLHLSWNPSIPRSPPHPHSFPSLCRELILSSQETRSPDKPRRFLSRPS